MIVNTNFQPMIKGYIMKKVLLGSFLLLGLSSSLFADMDIKGMIQGINPSNHTINVNGANVQILPHTEIKGDDCGMFGNDVIGNFASLKQGMFVDVDAYPGANGYVAEKVEWKCGGGRAY